MINIISLLFLFTASLNFNDVGEEILRKLQGKFDKVIDISTEFVQSTNGKAELKGKFFFKKEDNIRIELKNSTLVSDGSTNWSYNQKEHKVIISKNESSGASPFSLKKIVYEYPKECKVTSEIDNRTEVLVLTPDENSSISFNVIKIWLTKENLISRIVMEDKADNLIQIDFSKYKVNQKLSESKFNFSPPEGSKVIDLR